MLFGEGEPDIACYMDHTDNSAGNAEDHVKLILSKPGHPLIDLEISSCCAYPCFTYQLYGTRGGLKASTSAMEWRYFKRAEAPVRRLKKAPLAKPDGTPDYCRDNLTWHTGSWPQASQEKSDQAAYSAATAASLGSMNQAYYDMLYDTMVLGKPLVITPEQVRRQIAVIEQCRRLNPHIYQKR